MDGDRVAVSGVRRTVHRRSSPRDWSVLRCRDRRAARLQRRGRETALDVSGLGPGDGCAIGMAGDFALVCVRSGVVTVSGKHQSGVVSLGTYEPGPSIGGPPTSRPGGSEPVMPELLSSVNGQVWFLPSRQSKLGLITQGRT